MAPQVTVGHGDHSSDLTEQTSLRNAMTAYISAVDRDRQVEGISVDSADTINSLFDALQSGFGVSRILWRGGQDDLPLTGPLATHTSPQAALTSTG
jgi:hypothetical protein